MQTETKYTEKKYISDIEGLKNFYLLKYDDEQEIHMNIIENGKHAGHKTFNNNPAINELFQMKKDEMKISGTEMNCTIVKCTEIETGTL